MAILGGLVLTGLLISHPLSHSVGSWDESINRWFARHRTPTGNRITGDVTTVANAPCIAAVAAVLAVALVVRRKFRYAIGLVLALAVELAGFLASSYIVERPRPAVVRVGSTPSTYSWPSGHVAATLVLYGGVALFITLTAARRWPKAVAWIMATGLVASVGFARVYRGDHHLTDTVGGLLLGAGTLYLAVRVVSGRDRAGWRRSPNRPIGSGGGADGTVRRAA